METNEIFETNELVEETSNITVSEESIEQEISESTEVEKGDILTDDYQNHIESLLKNCRDGLNILENVWNMTKNEFKVTDVTMKEIRKFNSDNLEPKLPVVEEKYDDDGNLIPSEEHVYDPNNGIDKMTTDDVKRIFGEMSPIIAPEHTVTITRVKECLADYTAYVDGIREYLEIQNSYNRLIEEKEKTQINSLQEIINNETDEDKKAALQATIDNYYYYKQLKFLADPISTEDKIHLVKVFNDEGKIKYWVERAKVKLHQFKIDLRVLLEFYNFEKIYLDEQYHNQSNLLFLYFIQLLIYSSDAYNKTDPAHIKIVNMVLTIDKIVKNNTDIDTRAVILNNIAAFEDQFIGLIK